MNGTEELANGQTPPLDHLDTLNNIGNGTDNTGVGEKKQNRDYDVMNGRMLKDTQIQTGMMIMNRTEGPISMKRDHEIVQHSGINKGTIPNDTEIVTISPQSLNGTLQNLTGPRKNCLDFCRT